MKFEIRPATDADLEDLFTLERGISTAPHWPRGAYDAILADEIFAPRRCLIVAAGGNGGPLLGFSVAVVHPAGDAELESVAVADFARRQGIGRNLCTAAAEWCRLQGATELLLEVRAASNGAVELYTKLGFAEVGRRPDYYRNPQDDALVLRLKLPHSADISGRKVNP